MHPKCENHCSRETTQKEAEDLSIQLCFLTSTVRAPQVVVKGYVLVPGTDGGDGEGDEEGRGRGRRKEWGGGWVWVQGDGWTEECRRSGEWEMEREGFVEVDGGRGGAQRLSSVLWERKGQGVGILHLLSTSY